MWTEANVPIEQRYLIIFGIASQETINEVKEGLPDTFSRNTVIVFVDYSPADFPVGKVFTKVFQKDNVSNYESTECTILAVTQEFSKPFSGIPHGWKTICALEFNSTIPMLIQNLPEIEGWFDKHKIRVCLSSDETWQVLSQ